MPASDLVLSGDDTYMQTLPAEIFVDQVVLQGGGTANIVGYQIDIAAQSGGNNAAIKLNFVKQ